MEEKKMNETEQKEKDYAKGMDLIVSSIQVLTDPKNAAIVSKVVIKTDKGDITHKPKIEKKQFQNGIEVISRTEPCIDDLPQIIKDIAKVVSETGKCEVVGAYSIWNTEKDGEPVTYRFVQGEKMLNEWVIKSTQSEVTEEEVDGSN